METEMTTVGEEELGVNIDLDLEMNDDYMTTAMDSTTAATIMVDPTTVQINLKVNMNLSYSSFFSYGIFFMFLSNCGVTRID